MSYSLRLAALLLLAPMLIPAQVVVTNPANSPARSNSAAVPQQEVKPEDQCAVEGQILNAATGAPVKKAAVVLMRTDVTPATTNMPQQSYSATSDAAGKFAMKGIDPGKYRLTVTRNGFVNMSYGARVRSGPGPRSRSSVRRPSRTWI